MDYLENLQINLPNKLADNRLRESHEEFIKISRLIVKSQQRFRARNIMYFLEKLTRLH